MKEKNSCIGTNLRDGSRVLEKRKDIGIVFQVSFDGGL
jgi:hypothetical protein